MDHQLEHVIRHVIENQIQAVIVPRKFKNEAVSRLAAYMCRVNEKTPDRR